MSIADSHAKGNYIIGVKKSIIGAKVMNAAKEDLGKIEDLVIDLRDGSVAYAILSFGGFLGLGDKHFAIPWSVIEFRPSENCAVLKLDKERLQHAPGFNAGVWPEMGDKAWRDRVDAHFDSVPHSGAK